MQSYNTYSTQYKKLSRVWGNSRGGQVSIIFLNHSFSMAKLCVESKYWVIFVIR